VSLADADIDSIWTRIAADSVRAAERFIEHIEAGESLIGDFPEIGQARPDLAPDLRHWPVGSFLIL